MVALVNTVTVGSDVFVHQGSMGQTAESTLMNARPILVMAVGRAETKLDISVVFVHLVDAGINVKLVSSINCVLWSSSMTIRWSLSLVISTGDEKITCSNNSVPSRHLQGENLCNFCVCSNGVSRCSDLWCGLENCFMPNGTKCGSQEVCVPQTQETCLSSPCAPKGDCREIEPSKRVAPPMYPADVSCWPNQVRNYLDRSTHWYLWDILPLNRSR